jgi:hypothetical protein
MPSPARQRSHHAGSEGPSSRQSSSPIRTSPTDLRSKLERLSGRFRRRATTTSPAYAPPAARTGIAIAIPTVSSGNRWLIGTVLIAAMLYYFVGVDEGAASIFGKSTFIHELVHDARHLLGFPCH